MLYDVLVGMSLGFLVIAAVFAARKAPGWLGDQVKEALTAQREMQNALEDRGARLVEMEDSYDALEDRVAQIEKARRAENVQVLEMLDKVAHKLTDRERKRRRVLEEEIGEVDDAPNDPNQLLARARAAYPLPTLNGKPIDKDTLELFEDAVRP